MASACFCCAAAAEFCVSGRACAGHLVGMAHLQPRQGEELLQLLVDDEEQLLKVLSMVVRVVGLVLVGHFTRQGVRMGVARQHQECARPSLRTQRPPAVGSSCNRNPRGTLKTLRKKNLPNLGI